MKPFRLLLSIVILSLAGVAAAQDMPDKDLPGSHDHPLVSRFAGSLITGYQTVDYDRMLLPLGKTVDDKLSKSDMAEGRITRIAYVAPPERARWRSSATSSRHCSRRASPPVSHAKVTPRAATAMALPAPCSIRCSRR